MLPTYGIITEKVNKKIKLYFFLFMDRLLFNCIKITLHSLKKWQYIL